MEAAEPIVEEDMIEKLRSRICFEVPEPAIRLALSAFGSDLDAAVKYLHDNPGFLARPVTVVRANTSTGSRVLAPIKVKEEVDESVFESQKPVKAEIGVNVKKEVDASSCKRKASWEDGFDKFLKATDTKVMSEDVCRNSDVEQKPAIQAEEPKKVKQELSSGTGIKEEAVVIPDINEVKIPKNLIIPSTRKPVHVKKERVEEKPLNLEDGDFPEDPNWFLVGRKIVTALSTTRGKKLVDNEIVHFNFPHPAAKYNRQSIVRISTQRSGEVYF